MITYGLFDKSPERKREQWVPAYHISSSFSVAALFKLLKAHPFSSFLFFFPNSNSCISIQLTSCSSMYAYNCKIYTFILIILSIIYNRSVIENANTNLNQYWRCSMREAIMFKVMGGLTLFKIIETSPPPLIRRNYSWVREIIINPSHTVLAQTMNEFMKNHTFCSWVA